MKQSSWIYKLNKNFGTYECKRQLRWGNVSLCTLFWSTLLALLVVLLLSTAAILGVSLCIVAVLSVISPVILLAGYYPEWAVTLYPTLWVVCFLMLLCGAGITFDGGMRVVPSWLKFPYKQKATLQQEDNSFGVFKLVVGHIKSKKDKFCPIIKVTKD